ncbi:MULTISPECIES: hypothetical protein [Rhodococcus erythropolis group]|uniref:hypothetical protein n=1 Tax=Rhodococcus erythropolis group TaxID=2840174 RepID=UPI00107056FF|nr:MULTISPECIES: hypothetical protein [Rhodococcus erythropolis group]
MGSVKRDLGIGIVGGLITAGLIAGPKAGQRRWASAVDYFRNLGDFIGFPPQVIVVILLAICLYSGLGGIFIMNRTRHTVEEMESMLLVYRRNRASGEEDYIESIKKKKREGAFECAVSFAFAATTGYFLYSGFTYLG